MKLLKQIGAIVLLSVFVVVGTIGLGRFEKKEAEAQIINFTIGDLESILQFIETEAQEITIDQIRKIVLEQVLEKMIDKIVGGNSGGIGGGAGGTSGGGEGAFIKDYAQFLYVEAGDDIQGYVDSQFDAQFPSYIDPSVKDFTKKQYDENSQLVPTDCIDPDSYDSGDSDFYGKLSKSLQIGCNDISAKYLLAEQAQFQFAAIVQASKTEALANVGFIKKDEETNQLLQSGTTYEGIIQSLLQGVVDVQTNNESSISSIIGALVDQVLDDLISEEF